jgi:pimeloyl-ACP methyl ester carboxylesterase
MRVRTNLGELYVEDVGQGPPVVLWHSFLHHGGMWKAQIEALRTRHRVICIDAPGHGRSPVLRRAFDLDECARAVLEILDARSVECAGFAGLSWGGMVAIALVAMAPARVSSLALFDTSARREPRIKLARYFALGSVFRTLGAVPALTRQIVPIMFSEQTRRENPKLVEDWLAYVGGLDGASVWHALGCIMLRRARLTELSRVRVPTMVVVGEHDVAQPLVEAQAIADAIPGARLEIVRGAGHLTAVERPREVSALLASFFAEHAERVAPASARATA